VTRRPRALAVAAAVATLAGCGAHVVRPAARSAAIDPAILARGAATRVSYELHAGPPAATAFLVEAALRASLAAHGVGEARPADAIAPGWLHLSIHLLPRDATWASRCLMWPWGLLTVATLGLVPYSAEQEVRVEIYAVSDASGGPRVRTLRTGYAVASTVSWFVRPDEPGDFPAKVKSREQRATYVALRRVFDAAIADLLASAPGP
jgi:hypothetical protein